MASETGVADYGRIMTYTRRAIASGFALALIPLGLGGWLTARKVIDLSAEPTGDKECPPATTSESATVPTEAIASDTGSVTWSQRGGTVNDASCLNATPVHGVVRVTSVEDVANALRFARMHGLKVSIAGVRHCMGGQAFAPNAVVLDMIGFNTVSLDPARMLLTAQSGATWHDIQKALHPRFAVKATQSTDIFTVGGSISVNAHGMDHRAGSVATTLRSMRVMLADGTLRTVSRTEGAELFHLVVGGYGLFGVILDAEIEVTENVVYERDRRIVDYREFPPSSSGRLRDERSTACSMPTCRCLPSPSCARRSCTPTARSICPAL